MGLIVKFLVGLAWIGLPVSFVLMFMGLSGSKSKDKDVLLTAGLCIIVSLLICFLSLAWLLAYYVL